MKLYNVDTIVKEYRGCKDVPFRWFRCDHGTQKRPYADLIVNYKPSEENYYAEDYIEGLFTEDEAKQLQSYLDRVHGNAGTTTINEADLPAPNNVMGVGAIAVGGGDDFYVLNKEREYDLPFKVWGYLNLVGCELLDGSDVYHHRLLLMSNGNLRMQTNEEAAADEARF